MIIEVMLADVRFDDFQSLSFELLERNGRRVFGPTNSVVWWQINARDVGGENVLLALVNLENGCEPLYGIEWL